MERPVKRIEGARLLTGELVDVELEEGKICRLVLASGRCDDRDTGKAVDQGLHKQGLKTHAVMKQLPGNRELNEGELDARGNLLLPGLIEPHIHLDKAFLLDQMTEDAASLSEAIQMTAQLKQTFTPEDIRDRSLRVIERSIASGVTHMRCHAEVDPIVGLKGMEVTLALKEVLKDVITLQVVAFPQEGIFQQPGTAALMEEALRMGADVVGGIPYNDRDVQEHLDFVFDLAVRYDKPLDFHVDFSDDPSELSILEIVQRTLAMGLEGQVSVGHLTSLGSAPMEKARQVAREIAKAGIHVFALPATDLYLNGREDTERVRRGLTPVHLLLEEGVNVLFGSNNVRNGFTPFGTADPLDIALLLAQTTYMGSERDARLLFEMMTERAARALQIEDYGLRETAPADMVLFHAQSARDALLDRAQRSRVWKKGVLVAACNCETRVHWPYDDLVGG